LKVFVFASFARWSGGYLANCNGRRVVILYRRGRDLEIRDAAEGTQGLRAEEPLLRPSGSDGAVS
jgi:hypothetical protein